MERDRNRSRPQVIKKIDPPKKFSDQTPTWDEAKKKAYLVEEIAKDIEKTLDELGPKYKKLQEAVTSAYKAAPLTDCGFGVSPISPGRMMLAMKNHLRKNGVSFDGAYIGDVTKLPNFSAYVKESVKWLMKFSTTGGKING